MENIFEQFQGADIDRLVECLKAVKEAGLSVDKYCQSGVNQSSGNVWVWSEDWPGCVYCNIGFGVHWCYTCGECGEEHDFDTYSDLEKYAEECNTEAHDGKCSACGEWGDE